MPAQPATQHKYMRVIKSMDDDMEELLLYGFIGGYGYEDEDEDDMRAAAVVKAIKELDRKGKEFNIRINSPGGSVFHGDPIVTAIRNCKNKVHTFIDGMAASMAADIWMAGDMRHLVRTRIKAGEDPEAIRQWLVERYGEYVSYAPRVTGSTWPLFALPLDLLALAFALLRRRFGKGGGEQ